MGAAISPQAYPMSTNGQNKEDDQKKNVLLALMEDDGLAVVRVIGRANFVNSMPLKKFSQKVAEWPKPIKYIIDLGQCETMDSTFMGVIAGICISQSSKGAGKVIVVNANEHCQRLLKNLGLTHLLEMRLCAVEDIPGIEEKLKPCNVGAISKLDQICLTLQAHKNLVEVDQENHVKFQAVIEYLEKSLDEEKVSNNSNK